MSDSASEGVGKVPDQASDTRSDRMSYTLSDASFFTTPDAPEVQFLEPIQFRSGYSQNICDCDLVIDNCRPAT